MAHRLDCPPSSGRIFFHALRLPNDSKRQHQEPPALNLSPPSPLLQPPSILQNGTPSLLCERAFPCTILTPHVLPQSTALKSIKSVAPLLDRVLVQRIKAASKTSTGIFLTESSVKELNEAKVLAVGPGAFDKEGKRISMGVSIGDKVLIPQVSFPAHEDECGTGERTKGRNRGVEQALVEHEY